MFDYVCMFIIGRIACSAELTIKGRTPAAPAWANELFTVTVDEGDAAMLEVKITGWPRPVVKWLGPNGTEVNADQRRR